MDVGAWLRGLGLGQYETTFRESEIDAEVLPDLTEATSISSACRWGTASVSSRRSPLSGPGKPPPSRRAPRLIAACGRRRAPSDHRHVLRPRRVDKHGREA